MTGRVDLAQRLRAAGIWLPSSRRDTIAFALGLAIPVAVGAVFLALTSGASPGFASALGAGLIVLSGIALTLSNRRDRRSSKGNDVSHSDE